MTRTFSRLTGAALLMLGGCAAQTGSAPSLNVGQAALQSGAPATALTIARAALAASPGNVPALLLQAQSLAAEARPADAAAAYRQLLDLSPGSTEAQLGLARLTLAADPAAAETMFLAVATREPRNAIAWNDLGVARDLQGRHAPAQQAYRAALGIAPDMQAAEVNLAVSLSLTGGAAQAVTMLRPLAAAPGAPQRLRHNFALALELSGDAVDAAAALAPDLSAPDRAQALAAYDSLK